MARLNYQRVYIPSNYGKDKYIPYGFCFQVVSNFAASIGFCGSPFLLTHLHVPAGEALKMELTDSNFKKALEGKNAGD